MGTNNNNNKSLQEQINRLAHELDKERSTINQLRSSIDVLHSGWSLDKEKLSEAEYKLNEKDKPKIKKEKVEAEEIKMTRENSSCKRNMTTKSLSYKKVCKEGTSINDESVRNSINGLIPCPLCCKETFLTQEALKHHLYNYLENVICPMCSQNYENIGCLINHLEIGCESSILYTSSCTKKQIDTANCSASGQPFNLSESTLAIVSFKMPDSNIDQSALDGIQIIGGNIEPKTIPNKINSPKRKPNTASQKAMAIKQEQTKPPLKHDVDSDVEDVTEENAVVIDLSDNESVVNNNDDFDPDDDYGADAAVKSEGSKEKDEYFCSACDISFTSIIDHIKQYHFGEEVKIEGAPEKLKKKLLSCGKVISNNGESSKYTLQQNASDIDSLFKSNRKQNEKNNRGTKVTGYWTKRESYYNFVSNEEKMRLLYPHFKPPKTQITTSVDNNLGIKGRRTKKLFDNLDLIQMVDDKMLLGGASYSHISIYIVDEIKAKDRTKLGPVAKPISNLHRAKLKIESDDELEEFGSKSEDNKFNDESLQKKRAAQYILLLKVPLGKDKEITIENVDFNVLPIVHENIVPYLENITNPEIPLLKGAKRLKWQCSLCLTRLSSYFVASKRHNCYKCQYCGAGFRKNISVFMKHLLSCAKNKANAAKPFACSCCPSFFKTMEEARSHMPLHMPGSRAVQCSLCYALFRDKTILNNHLMDEHDTDISQLGCQVKQPRLKAKSKYITSPNPSSQRRRSGSNKKNKCNLDSPYRSSYKQTIKTEDCFSEMEIKKENVDDSTPSRSSRKRKINKTYFDECYVY